MHDTAPLPSHEPRPKRAFVRDEEGGILVFWALFLAIAFGFVALTFDIGRVANTQSELQSYADQVALAAAGELDGRSSAIVRATDAADGLISRRQTFGDGGEEMRGQGEYTLTFLSSLPANDRDPATATTTDPTRARFVQVSVNQRNVQTPFAAINATLVGRAGANAQSQVGASAVAGVASYACDITPLFFCVPSGWNADLNIGQQIELRSGGQGSAWGPGNFGFLDPASLDVDEDGACATLSGANLYRCLVGAERSITKCIRTDAGIETLTGQRQGLVRAFNTRFDIFQGSMQSERNNADYRPAPNTIQGTIPRGGECRGNNVDPSEAMALPRDAEIIAGTSRFGSGNWARQAYLDQNHGGEWPTGGVPPLNFTRYQVYLAEIAAAQSRTAPNNVPLPGFDETGAAQCHQLGPSSDPNRRTVIAAAVVCDGDMAGKSDVFPMEYVRVLMTEPVLEMGGGDKGKILVEVVETVGGVGSGSGADTGIYREVIQLHR